MIHYLDILTILSIGLLIGTEFAVSVFINPVLWRLDDQAQAFAIKAFARKLGKAMPFWYGGSFLLLMAEAILRWSHPGESLVIGSCAVWAAVIVLTLLFLVPINNRIASVEDVVLSDAVKQEHKRWDARHRLRVAALIVAMILFLSVVVGGNIV